MDETRFARYLRIKGIEHAEIGNRIGLSQSSISRIAAGKQEPSLKKAVQIEAETKNYVRCRDLLKRD